MLWELGILTAKTLVALMGLQPEVLVVQCGGTVRKWRQALAALLPGVMKLVGPDAAEFERREGESKAILQEGGCVAPWLEGVQRAPREELRGLVHVHARRLAGARSAEEGRRRTAANLGGWEDAWGMERGGIDAGRLWAVLRSPLIPQYVRDKVWRLLQNALNTGHRARYNGIADPSGHCVATGCQGEVESPVHFASGCCRARSLWGRAGALWEQVCMVQEEGAAAPPQPEDNWRVPPPTSMGAWARATVSKQGGGKWGALGYLLFTTCIAALWRVRCQAQHGKSDTPGAVIAVRAFREAHGIVQAEGRRKPPFRALISGGTPLSLIKAFIAMIHAWDDDLESSLADVH